MATYAVDISDDDSCAVVDLFDVVVVVALSYSSPKSLTLDRR